MSARVWLRLFRLLISSVTKRRTKIEVAIALHKIACQAWEDAELWHRGSGRISNTTHSIKEEGLQNSAASP